MSRPVREPLWQGHQSVAALWFDAGLSNAEQREQWMLDAWLPGSYALRFPAGDLLCFGQPQWRDCAQGHGLPLRRCDGALLSGPLRADERKLPDGANLALVQGAQVFALRLEDGQPLDLSRHLLLDAYALHEAYDFAAAPRDDAPPLAGKDMREVLGQRMPQPSDAARRLLQRLQKRNAPGSRRRWNPFASLFDWLAGAAAAPQAGRGNRVPARRGAPRPPSAWRGWLARAMALTGAAQLLGWRQGLYLRRLLRLFETNDLDEALRNALPLDGTGASLGQAFGTPGRRGSLQLGSGSGAAFNLGLPDYLHQHLRQLYRQAFERLDRAGRTDEAVFVLAELLGAREEALDYLLRHGRGQQAAELALGWDMPAATIVRLLLLAGDLRRAVQVARRDDAFSAAITLLQASHPEQADALRREWGVSLVARGEWLRAVEAVWPLADMRELAAGWLLSAELAGAEFGARALVQRAALLPDSMHGQLAQLHWLADPLSPAADRAAAARMLLAVPQRNAALSRLAALLLPAVAADRAQGKNSLSGKELSGLGRHVGADPVAADMPAWLLPPEPAAQPLFDGNGPLLLAAPAAGLHPISDAGALGADRYLVALGEAGVITVDGAGRTLQHYAVPAHDLVIARNGRIALAITRREQSMRVSRLDLVHQHIRDLGSLPLQRFSRDFDGLVWTLCGKQEIRQLDTSSSELAVLWRVDTEGLIALANFGRDQDSYLVHDRHGFQLWCYSGSARRLSRVVVNPEAQRQALLCAHTFMQTWREQDAQGSAWLCAAVHGLEHRPPLRIALDPAAAAASLGECGLEGHYLLATFDAPDTQLVRIFQANSGIALLQIDWPGSVQGRWRGKDLVLFDARGRLLHIDGQRIRSLTLT